MTFTTSTKLSLTAEVQFNGLSLGAADWARLARSNPQALGAYLLDVQRQQELAKIILADPAVESLSSYIGVDGDNATLNSGRLLINLKAHGQRNLSAAQVITTR